MEGAAPLPPPQGLGPVSTEGNAELEIVNDTPYGLPLEFEGPTSRTVTIERCAECKEYYFVGPFICPSGRSEATFWLPPGTYQVTARVDAPDAVPYVGTWELEGDLYIVSQFK